EQVCLEDTGHAETVLVEYDEDEVALEKILEVFFAIHDPTTLDRQGNDVGSQYRSIILWTEPRQEKVIKDYLNTIKDDFPAPIVTQIKKLDKFYSAENYHLDYYNRNKRQPYCQMVIWPKIRKMEKDFTDLLK
ncbi:MAG: peptide-methionine (S)-S-oxide reductase MsrA, partial [Smithella sp.]